MSKVVVFDGGNSIIKYRSLSGREGYYTHALHEITAAKFNEVIANNHGNAPEGFITVNGRHYVFGEKAYQFGTIQTRVGRAKYTPDYFGVLAAIALADLYQSSQPDIIMFAAHPPKDAENRMYIGEALKGVWHVEYMGRQMTFNVVGVDTFNEPEGGLFNRALNTDGIAYQNNVFMDGSTLVIDVGGHTTDFVALEANFELNQSVRISVELGILDVIRELQKSLYDRFSHETRGTLHLDQRQLRDAITSRTYAGGGRKYDVGNEVDAAVNVIMNRIQTTFNTDARGAFAWNAILLTGGGSALLLPHLNEVLNHPQTILAGEPHEMHLANVRGGAKLWKLYEAYDNA